MIKLVTFTDHNMTISANKCAESAMRHGADAYSIWTPNDLPEWFKTEMAEVLAIPFGAGLYCWKPYIVWHELQHLKDGDILVYCDAGNEWVSDVRPAINGMKDDCLFFSNGWPNGDWCKMDVAKALLSPQRMDEFLKSPQLQASTFFLRKTQSMIDMMQLWVGCSMRKSFIDNSPSIEPNVPTFRETRWDQSILSAIVYQRNIPLYWFPTKTALHLPNRKSAWYSVLLDHHRRRNDQWP